MRGIERVWEGKEAESTLTSLPISVVELPCRILCTVISPDFFLEGQWFGEQQRV